MRSIVRRLLLSGSGVAMALTAAGASAQQQLSDSAGQANRSSAIGPQQPAPASGASTAREADVAVDQASAQSDIVVTALKREQSIQDIPAAVSAIGARDIQDQGITDATNLQFRVPSLVAGKLAGVTAISVRGVGLNQYGPTAQPGVAVHVDGVYQARTLSGGLGQIDLDRIEVLRGPQGTLYGRNATGGAVNFITAAPTDKLQGSVMAGFATYDEYHLRGVLNVPLSDSVRTRLVVDYDDRAHGFVKNVSPGGPDADKGSALTGRLKVAADLTDNLQAVITGFYMHRHGGFPWLQLASPPSATAIAGNPFLAGAIVPSKGLRFSADLAPTSNLNTYGGSGMLSWNLGSVKVKSITSYAWFRYHDRYDSDGTNVPFIALADVINSKTLTQEINVNGDSGRLDWLVGAFYLDDDLRTSSNFLFPIGYPSSGLAPGGRVFTGDHPYKTQSVAIFTDDTVNLTSRLKLLVGARYSWDKVTSRETQTISQIQLAPGFILPSLTTCPAVRVEPNFHSFTPRGGLQYDVGDGINAYATVSRGFKDGGVDGCTTIYRPEKITAYEGGVRLKLFDGSLTFNPTIFYYDYTDFQVVQFLGLTSPVINAPKATELGFELESALRASSHLSFSANLTLLDATYGDGFSNTDTLNAALGPQNLSGRRLNRAPTASGSFGVEYRTAMTSYGRFSLRGDVYASSRVYFREFNSAQDSQSAYSVANLNLVWDSPGERYGARLYVTNLGDARYLAQLGASDAYGSRFSAYGAPRQVGIELRAQF